MRARTVALQHASDKVERNMKITGDYHLHTFVSDGRCTPFSHAKVAKRLGLEQIAITDHSFASFVFHTTRRKFDRQQRQIDKINAECGKYFVLHGIEGNLTNEKGEIDVPDDVIRRCDVLHLGFHRFLDFKRLFGAWKFVTINGYGSREKREKLIETNTQAYISAMKRYPIDCLAHLNHRALVDVRKVCEVAREKDVYIELNAKHLDAIEECADIIANSGVKLLVGTDAHDTSKLGKAESVLDFVARHNIPKERVFGIDGNMPTFKSKKDWN